MRNSSSYWFMPSFNSLTSKKYLRRLSRVVLMAGCLKSCKKSSLRSSKKNSKMKQSLKNRLLKESQAAARTTVWVQVMKILLTGQNWLCQITRLNKERDGMMYKKKRTRDCQRNGNSCLINHCMLTWKGKFMSIKTWIQSSLRWSRNSLMTITNKTILISKTK